MPARLHVLTQKLMNLARLRRGHIPGALNVPWTELVREGELKRPMNWMRYFGRGVSYDKPIIVSCGSGVTAAVVLLALATLDAKRETVRRRME